MAVFTEEFTRMRQDFDQAQADRDQLFHDTREFVQNMSQNVQQKLSGFRSEMQHMHEELAAMADRVRDELKEMHTDLNTGGNVFRKQSPKPARRSQKRS
jgi:predicted  nucleic acid-binding Zn-ribbon protein